MPIISVFFGIVIRMFYREHEPVHFHAEYQAEQAKFDLDGKIIAGNIQSRTARRLINSGRLVIGGSSRRTGTT